MIPRPFSSHLCITALLALCACQATPTPETLEAEPTPNTTPLLQNPHTAPKTPKAANFLALSDLHFGASASGQWYCPTCETGTLLLDNAFAEAKRLIERETPGFILYLGDLPAHNESENTREAEFKKTLDGLAGMVEQNKHIRLLYLPGNNDSVGPDYCAFTRNGQSPFSFSSKPDTWPVINGDKDIINKDGVEHGYYSVYPLGAPTKGAAKPSLRVIAMNTVMFTTDYGKCITRPLQEKHTQAQMGWLSTQLQKARTSGDKVLLAMHVPPGLDGYSNTQMWDPTLKYKNQWVQRAFLEEVAQHADIITGVLTAHTHTNGIRRLHNCKSTPDFVELSLSIASVTTDHGNNPS